MVDWMIEVLTNFKCDDLTFFLAVSLMDRYFKGCQKELKIVNLQRAYCGPPWLRSRCPWWRRGSSARRRRRGEATRWRVRVAMLLQATRRMQDLRQIGGGREQRANTCHQLARNAGHVRTHTARCVQQPLVQGPCEAVRADRTTNRTTLWPMAMQQPLVQGSCEAVRADRTTNRTTLWQMAMQQPLVQGSSEAVRACRTTNRTTHWQPAMRQPLVPRVMRQTTMAKMDLRRCYHTGGHCGHRPRNNRLRNGSCTQRRR